MVLFGKEINVNLPVDMSEKDANKLILAIAGITFIVLAVFFIVFPVQEIFKKNEEIERIKIQRDSAEARFKKEKAETQRRYDLFQQQQKEFSKLKDRFNNSVLTDETKLKVMVYEMAKHFNVEIKEIGPVGNIEIKKDFYRKEYTPYTIEGKIQNIGKLFSVLEESKYLIVLRGNTINIDKAENNRVKVNVKIGIFFVEEGGKLARGINSGNQIEEIK